MTGRGNLTIRQRFEDFLSHLNDARKIFISFVKDVYLQAFMRDNISLMAAAISFYALLSIIPILLVFVSISGYIMHSSEAAFQRVSEFLVTIVPSSTTATLDFLKDFVRKKNVFGGIGILGLIWAGSRIFAAVENSINVVWRAEKGRAFWKSKILSVILVPGSIVALILSIALTAIYTFAIKLSVPFINLSIIEISYIGRAVSLVAPVILSIMAFTMIYKFIPNRTIPWGPVIVGAIFAGISWEVAKVLFDIYMRNYTNYTRIYGSFGTIVIAIFWIYYSALILLLGAEIGVVLDEYRRRADFLRVFDRIDWLKAED